MRIDCITPGSNPPFDINVLVEAPIGGEPIKYELDKASGTLIVDRMLYTSMHYPGLPEMMLSRIAHFYHHYKDLETGKWVKLDRWGDASEARALIEAAIKAAREKA